jgi:DNA-binding LytR/AlgR family response regulator
VRIAIVEDETIVAQRLERMVRELAGSDAESVTRVDSLPRALELVTSEPIDLLFLDLNLNGRNGFSVLDHAASAAFQTIVVSAHHEQALRAFDFGVTDFVAKPFTRERLRKAIDRALGRDGAPRTRARCLAVRKGREVRTIPVDAITYIRGADDFSEVHMEDGLTHLHQKTLAALENLLPESFARVHRSYIANLARARGIRGTTLVMNDAHLLPIGRSYRDDVRKWLGLL